MKRLPLILLLMLAVTPVYALAYSPQNVMGIESTQPSFSKLDKNQDGYIDKHEAKTDANLEFKFNVLAQNGRIDEKTYDQWVEEIPLY